MNVEKAAYWLALAAFGFALQGVCPRGTLQSLDHAFAHTGSTLCRLAANAEHAVTASALIIHPLQKHDFWSASDAKQLAQDHRDLAYAQIEQARDQAEQARDQALATADAVREQALAKAETMRDEALANADAMRDEALAQAVMARAEVELHRAEIEHLQLRVRPQIRLSHAAKRRLVVMSADPCDYSQASDAVGASIELSDDEQ